MRITASKGGVNIRKNLIRIILIILFSGLFIFGVTLKKVGERRQVRFNLGMMYKLMNEYYRHHQRYPESLAKFPKFYVVSPIEKFYLDSNMLAKGVFGGYRYNLTLVGGDRFVVSASPVGFWPLASEFGISEKGILKENKTAVDGTEDSYGEVDIWKPYQSKNTVQVP